MLVDVLKNYGGIEVSAMELYSDMFQFENDYIQCEELNNGEFKANPLGYGINSVDENGNYRILFKDTFEKNLKFLQDKDFAIINGITYFGRRNIQEKASKMFAMIIDFDGIDDKYLSNFLFGAGNGHYPVPNYVALSGHGVHLYYLFEEPISLYPNLKIQLKQLKYALMRKIWNRNNTSLYEKVQYQGINQGFRVIGGKTKIEGIRVKAYRVNTHPFSLEQLVSYVDYEVIVDENKRYDESKMSLAEAKKRYPQWYQDVIIENQVKNGHWICKDDLYYWWLRTIKGGASFGHRYFCVMCLAIYAVKSGIDKEQLEYDSYSLIDKFNELKPDEPFTKNDIDSALECFDLKYVTFPLDDIIRISGIRIEKNKRNGRKQEQHLQLARGIRVLKGQMGENVVGGGRPSAEQQVQQWRKNNPTGKKVECNRETRLDPKTIRKWWK